MAAAQPKVKPKDIHLRAAQPKPKLSFDVTKPVKQGKLLKQGEKLKQFKERFFVLYPNFLVFYNDVSSWQFDITVGNLGSRKGAIKLSGGRLVPVTSENIGQTKFPIVLDVPDVTNKRDNYVLDCESEEEQKSWVEAIKNAIPAPADTKNDKSKKK